MNILQLLIDAGFSIHYDEGSYVVTGNGMDGTYERFRSLQHAVEFAFYELNKLAEAKKHEFTVIVRYNRGLGIEYRNLPNIEATTLEEAKAKAAEICNKTFSAKDVIHEIKVRPKN
jgi:hypothetical protein